MTRYFQLDITDEGNGAPFDGRWEDWPDEGGDATHIGDPSVRCGVYFDTERCCVVMYYERLRDDAPPVVFEESEQQQVRIRDIDGRTRGEPTNSPLIGGKEQT